MPTDKIFELAQSEAENLSDILEIDIRDPREEVFREHAARVLSKHIEHAIKKAQIEIGSFERWSATYYLEG